MIWNRCILAALVVALTASCRQDNEYLRTTKGFLLQHKGKTRAALRIKGGNPMLEFYRSDGKTAQAHIRTNDQGVYLQFADANGNTRLFMKTQADGFTSLAFMGRSKNPVIAMGYKPAATMATLQLFDQDGNSRVVVEASHEAAGIKLHGVGLPLALWGAILLYDADKALMMITNKDGKILFSAPRKWR